MRFAVRQVCLVAMTGLGLVACATSVPRVSATTSSNPTRPTPPTAQTEVTCPQHAYRAQSSDLSDQITAIDTTCDMATRVVAAAPDRPNIDQPYAALGFHCVPGPESQPPGGGKSHFPFRCDDGQRAVITFNRY